MLRNALLRLPPRPCASAISSRHYATVSERDADTLKRIAERPPHPSWDACDEFIETPEKIAGGLWVTKRPRPLTYRTVNKPTWGLSLLATLAGAFMWTWVLTHLYFEPEHVLGHHEWPDVTKWTDEELGIPDEIPLGEEVQ